MSRAIDLIKKYGLTKFDEKCYYINKSNNTFFNLKKLNEGISKADLTSLLDSIIEYTTRSKKDLEQDNEEVLKVDLQQLIKYSQEISSLLGDEEPATTTSGSEVGEENL